MICMGYLGPLKCQHFWVPNYGKASHNNYGRFGRSR